MWYWLGSQTERIKTQQARMLVIFIIYIKTFGKIVACEADHRPSEYITIGEKADKIHNVLAVSSHIQQSPKTRGRKCASRHGREYFSACG